MKLSIAIVAILSLTGLVQAAPDDLEDSYAKLKESVEKKDADGVKANGAATLKLAKALGTAPKPTDPEEAKNWEQRVQYGKEVEAYTEYALGFTAAQGIEPAKTVELVDALIAQNPKSQYLDDACVNAYLVALGKTGNLQKQLDGMVKIAAGKDNEIALKTLAESLMSKSPDRAQGYAHRLLSVMAKRSKPEGVSEAEWTRTKNTMLATGYYVSGVVYGSKQAWLDCDKQLKAALPLISGDQTRLGITYFYLGLANYQFGKITMDRTKMQAGLVYSKKSAAIKGPMQEQAYRNQMGIQTELNAHH